MRTRVPLADDFVNGDVSFWYADRPPPPREPLPGDRDADVCIVGAGYTGLWTAYYLKKADPSLRIAVLEARFAGFGASGRNGGWLNDGSRAARPLREHPTAATAVLRLQQAMFDAVDEVIATAGARGSTPTSSRAACST